MGSVMDPSEFDVQNITYGTPKTLDNGGKSIYISFKKNPIILQTPEMIAPFGHGFYDPNKNNKNKGQSSETTQKIKYSLDLSFNGMENREKLKTFFDKLSELDNKLIDDAQANSFEWLKKKNATREVIVSSYTKLIKYSIDSQGDIVTKYAPNFKVTIPYKDGEFQCEVYDVNQKPVDLNKIETKGARVAAIIQCLGIWVAAGKFGCTWKVLQMRVIPRQTIKGYAFREIDSAVETQAEVDHEEKHDEDDDNLHANAHDSDVISTDEDELNPRKGGSSSSKK